MRHGCSRLFFYFFLAIVVKSTNRKRIEENVHLDKDISKEDINTLNNLGSKEKYAWNPENVL